MKADRSPWFIYTLESPESGQIRYVGCTTNPKIRIRTHIHQARMGYENSLKAEWIRELLSSGKSPLLKVVESGSGPWEHIEERWISSLRQSGCNLTNMSTGGKGSAGLKASPEACEKRSAAMKGRFFSEEHRRKISEAKRGATSEAIRLAAERARAALNAKPRSAESNEKRRITQTGRKRPPEVVAKIAAANSGKKRTPEQRLNMSMAQRRSLP